MKNLRDSAVLTQVCSECVCVREREINNVLTGLEPASPSCVVFIYAEEGPVVEYIVHFDGHG